MSAVSKRVYLELQAAKKELEGLRQKNADLKQENLQLRHQTKLAYLEGVDQGRESIFLEAI